MARVDGDAAPGGERYAQGAERAGKVIRQITEKNIAGVEVEQVGKLFRVLLAPVFDALHRSLFQRQIAALHQRLADGFVGMAVLVGIADAHGFAAGQRDFSRALDLQEKQFNGVIHPIQFLALERRDPVVDFGAVVIGHHPATVKPTAQAQVFQFRIDAAQIHDQQVVGQAVKRMAIALRGRAAAVEQRFVIAGNQPFGAAVGLRGLIGGEILFKEFPQGRVVR